MALESGFWNTPCTKNGNKRKILLCGSMVYVSECHLEAYAANSDLILAGAGKTVVL